MGNKVIKGSIFSSKSLAQCSLLADLAWPRFLLCGDDWGCCEMDAELFKKKCFLRRDDVTEEMVESWLCEYEATGQLFRWSVRDRHYGYYITNTRHSSIPPSRWHQRRTPVPPRSLLVKYLQGHSILFKEIRDGSVIFDEVQEETKPFPNPNPNPNPNPKPEHKPKEKGSHPSSSPYYLLAKRIIESAASLDAPKVGLNKDTPTQREKRIQDSAEDIRKLFERSWKPWNTKKALILANEIWNWVEAEEDRPGFMWKKNIRSGYKFRYHCDSQLRYKGKEGGELLRQYRASPVYKAKREVEDRMRQAARMKIEFKEEETQAQAAEDEEKRLAQIRKEQGDEAWAKTLLFEMLGYKDLQTVKADPFLYPVSKRIQEAVGILEKEMPCLEN